jgi:hypothetical protein
MKTSRANNPRGPFSDTVALRVWRSPYDDNGVSKLFIEVSFKEGRVGSEDDSPIRFRLRLRQAEVTIRPDVARVLALVDSSVARSASPSGTRTRTTTRSGKLAGNASIGMSASNLDATLDASAEGSLAWNEVVEFAQSISHAAIQTWPTADGGYTFVVQPDGGQNVLKNSPWDANVSRVSIRDQSHPRKGEPPEPMVHVTCAIEDLLIEGIEYKSRKATFFDSLPKAKRTAVVQYIRKRLAEEGIDFGTSLDPFAKLTLADATPREDVGGIDE